MGERLTATGPPHQAGDPAPPRPPDDPRLKHPGWYMPSDYPPARPKTELRRVTIHEHDDRLSVMRLRGIGFSWRCTCGERGRVYGGRWLAIEAKRQHEANHH